ncbi:hypothetical protein [Paraburkholderia sp.]|uniref:hypothetical protein n=1 Tax=Paraburkholderia sp. TaxID=1926495 RepID=UPI003D6FDA35
MQDDAGTSACANERLETKKAGDESQLTPRATDKPSCIKNYPTRDGRRCLGTTLKDLRQARNLAAN